MHLWKLRLECNLYKAILAAILWTGLTAGCSVLGRTAVPTPFPDDFIETAIKMTVEAGELSTSAAILNPSTPEATETPTPQNLSPNPESSESTPNPSGGGAISTDAVIQPSATDIASPTPGMLEAAIQITSPGPMSKIISSLNVIGTLNTEPDGHMQIEVWLEPLTPDGQPRLLMRELQNFISDPTAWIYISREFEIEISRLSEFAQLRVSTYDAENRMVALASVDLLLLSVGDMELNPAGNLQEPIVILEPGENKLIQGGTAFVSGLVHPSGDQFLTVNMTAPDGKVVGIQQIAVTPSPQGGYVPFSIEMPYYVSESTRVRLAVYENIGRIPGITHLTSIEVLVSP